jgi:hypothetical protein
LTGCGGQIGILNIEKEWNLVEQSAYGRDNLGSSLLKDKLLKKGIRYLFKSLILKQYSGLSNLPRDKFYESAKGGCPALIFLLVQLYT